MFQTNKTFNRDKLANVLQRKRKIMKINEGDLKTS